MGRSLLALLALACMLTPLGCASESPQPGPPATRHGERPLTALGTVEEVRARLVAASDLYVLRSDADARAQLRAARAAYASLSGRVRVGDRVLDREIVAAFGLIDSLIARGAGLETVREPIAALSGQLMAAAWRELVTFDARVDPGVAAEVLLRLTAALEREYARGVQPGSGNAGKLAFEHAYGLLARSQIVARGLADVLGPQQETVTETLSVVRERSFPLDVARTPFPPSAGLLAHDLAAVRSAVASRFGLSGAARVQPGGGTDGG